MNDELSRTFPRLRLHASQALGRLGLPYVPAKFSGLKFTNAWPALTGLFSLPCALLAIAKSSSGVCYEKPLRSGEA